MRHVALLTALIAGYAVAASAPQAGADDLPAEIKLELGADPAAPLELLPVYSAEAGDRIIIGAEQEMAHELTAVYFASLGQGRSLWRLQFTEPWEERGNVALILYIDADNDPATGRQGGGVQGTDIMLRPDTLSIHDFPATVTHVTAAHGDSLYFGLQAPLNVEGDEVVFRAYVLVQERDNTADHCRTPWFEVRVPAPETQPFAVAEGHPLHRAPEVIEQVGVRVPVDAGGTRAVVTWITSWPTESVVQWGEQGNLNAMVRGGDRPAQNHRVVLDGLEPDRTYHLRVRARSGDGSLLSGDEVGFSTAVEEPAGSVARERIPVTISGAPGAAQPVTGGVPFPRGVLGSADNIRLLDPAGNEVPLQAQTTVRWPDNSVKWALLDLQAEIPASGEVSYALEFGTEVTRAPVASAISIEEDEDAIVVDTGPLRVRLDRADFALLGEAWLGGERITDAAGAGIFLTDLDGEQFTSLGAPDELYVSRAGPLSAIVAAGGRHLSEANEPLFAWKVALQFYAGQPLVRLLHVFENDMVEREEQFTTVRSLDLRLPLAGGQSGGRVLLPDGVAADLPGGALSRLLQGYDDSIRLEGIEADIAGDQRAPGAMGLQGAQGALTLAVRDFWQLYPKSIGADAEGGVVGIMPALPAEDYTEFDDEILFHRLWYYLEGGVYRYRLGMSKTHELLVRFHPGAVGDDEVRALSQLSARQPLIIARPEWYAQTKAFGDITPRTEGEFVEYEEMVDRTLASFVRDREERREYGMLNLGDWWGERGYNWGNIEYDTQHGLFMQFARTGDREFFDNAALAARHNTDVDIVHHSHDPLHVGRPYAHCMYHVGNYFPDYDGPSATLRGSPNSGGHLWTRGNLEFALLTGDDRAFRIALNTADFLAGARATGYRMPKGAERESAWQLYGLLAAYDFTADEHYLNAVRIITREIVREQNREEGHWNIPAGYSQVRPTPIGGYAWCAGLLMTALEWANRHLEDPEIDETILRAARWLARTEWIPEARGFRSASCDTLSAAARPGSNSNRTPAAMLRAYELTGEEQFRDIAHTGFSYAVRGSGGGKGGSTRLTLSPHTVYKLKAAGITSLDTARWEAEVGLRAPGFVSIEAGEAVRVPVAVSSNRDDPLRVSVRIEAAPEVWPPMEVGAVELPPRGSGELTVSLRAPEQLGPGTTVALTVIAGPDGGAEVRQNVLLALPAEMAIGEAVGLVPGEPEFLAPALEMVGVEARRIESLQDLSAFAAIFLSTQAHHVNSAGLQKDYPHLLQWVHGGGRLVISQMQDAGWRPEYLPGTVRLSDTSTESGAIAAPEHPIFAGISGADALSGMVMYDSIAEAEGWQVLLEDARGGPAIITTDLGEGQILAFMPSVERYLTGEASAADSERFAAYGRLFRNIALWAVSANDRADA